MVYNIKLPADAGNKVDESDRIVLKNESLKQNNVLKEAEKLP